MRKLVRPQDILLLGLAGVLDTFEELRDPFGLVSKNYESMYGWVPKQYRKNNFGNLIWRSLKAGYIEKIEKKGNAYIRITSQGQERIQRDFPLLDFQKKPWDGKWRIVMFDISELEKEKRNYLRRKLKELGFGMLQESVFITPHNIIKDFSEYLDNIDLSKYVYMLEVSNILVGDFKELARKVWNLDQLNKKYKEISSYLTTLNGRTIQLNIQEQRKMEIRKIRGKYLQVLLSDPFLPKELLPSDWAGYQAKKLIKSL